MRRVPPDPPSGGKRRAQYWLRWAHVYISMISLLLVLFFGLTGITLNHPEWTFLGADTTTQSVTGLLPEELIATDQVGSVDEADNQPDGTLFLAVSRLVRGRHDVSGEVSDFSIDGDRGSISYRAPGYGADLFFDVGTGEYELTESRQGWLGVMNELHKGRDSSSAWRWVVDISGGLLVVVAVTGLGIQLLMRKRRVRALTLTLLACIATVLAIMVAMP